MKPAPKKHRLDEPRNVTRIYYALIGVCVLLVLADLLPYERHLHYDWEAWFGFHGFFGFVSFILLVLAGKYLRKILMREEDYYDR